MHITLKPGEHIAIQFHQTDGEFEIHFDTPKHPKALVVEEVSQALTNVVGVLLHEPLLYDDDTDDDDSDTPIGSHQNDPEPVGFFMDAHNRIHCTAFVHCRVDDASWKSKSDNRKWVVETLNADDDVTGEFDFYATLEELESASGLKQARKIIA